MYTLSFTDPDCQVSALVGGKALGLAEMTIHGLPVAPGFVVTTAAHEKYLQAADVQDRLASILSEADHTRPASLSRAEQLAADLLADQPLPGEIVDAVRTRYTELSEQVGVTDLSVAVRSSATAEDSAAASFAGEFETWVDVVGAEAVLEHVRRSYAAVYAGRALSYMIEQQLDPRAVRMAVVIQKTVRARAAGVMFTLDPINGDRSKISIEANWGLGLSVVGGEVTPDRYTVEKVGLRISGRTLGDKRIEYRRGDAPSEVPPQRQSQLCLVDSEILTVAGLGKQVERLHRAPQDIEFAVDEELPDRQNVILLQCRPETIWSSRSRAPLFDPTAGIASWLTASITGRTRPDHSSPSNEVSVHD